MKLFVVMRDEMMIAEGVMFLGGSIVVHALLRRERDAITRFATIADVKHYYRNCEIELVSAGPAS